jgi:hypothetical protein
MSMPPPGYEPPQASPPSPSPPATQGAPLSHEHAKAQSGGRQANDSVHYEFKSVRALRGRESSAKAKWQDQGWEFVSENRGALRTELNFRRAKPKTFGAHLLSFVATLQRLQPKQQLALVALGALMLVASIVGIAVETQSGDDAPDPSAAQIRATTAPPAEPTVTRTTVDELLDDAEPSGTSRPTERPAKARARARARARTRARVKRRERALQRERQRNTAKLQSGVTCAELGESDIKVNPGADIDADGDGIGCES